jgi:hypothetical protein
MAGDESPSLEQIAEFTSDQLFEVVGQLHAAEVATHQKLLRFLSVIDEQERWREDFSHSMIDWVVARFSVDRRTAAEWVRVARALRGLPAISEVVAEGRLSWDQLAPLTEFATETTDHVLAGAAPGWSAAETRDLARRAKAPKVADANEAHRARRLTWWQDAHLLHLRGALPTEAGAQLTAGSPRSQVLLPKTPTQRRTSPSRHVPPTRSSSSPRRRRVRSPSPTAPS